MTTQQMLENFILTELLFSGSIKKLDYDQSLLSSGILDSLSLLRLIDYIQEDMGVEIDVEEITPDNFQTINAAARLIESKR